MPCPVGVDIPGIFKIRNEGAVFDAPTSAKAAYGRMQPENRQTRAVMKQCAQQHQRQIPKIAPGIKKQAHEG